MVFDFLDCLFGFYGASTSTFTFIYPNIKLSQKLCARYKIHQNEN